jgi:hypothetical protein
MSLDGNNISEILSVQHFDISTPGFHFQIILDSNDLLYRIENTPYISFSFVS